MTRHGNGIEITDYSIWFAHLHLPGLVSKLEALHPEEEIMLETDGVVGRWQRMKVGRDGRSVQGIKPVGSMKSVWGKWFKSRKGEIIEIREVRLADDYLSAASSLFSEWASPEDEEAFRDL